MDFSPELPFQLAAAQGLFLCAALFLAAVVRGLSGFGFSAIFILMAAAVTNPLPLIPVVFVCEIAMTVFQARDIRPHVDWRRTLPLLAGAALALWPAVGFLAALDPSVARLMISALVLALCLLLLTGWQLERDLGRRGHFVVGIVAGAANGAGVGGLPTAGALAAQAMRPAAFRATMIVFLTGLDLLSLPVMAGHGLVGPDTAKAALIAFPILGLGVWIGTVGFARVFAAGGDRNFRRGILLLLGALACTNILRVLL